MTRQQGPNGTGPKAPEFSGVREIHQARRMFARQLLARVEKIDASKGPARERLISEFRRWYGFEPEPEGIAIIKVAKPPAMAAGDSHLISLVQTPYGFGANRARLPEGQLPSMEAVTNAVYLALLTSDAESVVNSFFAGMPLRPIDLMDAAEDLVDFGEAPSAMNIYTSTAKLVMLSRSLPIDPQESIDPISLIIFREIREFTNLPSHAVLAVFRDGSQNQMRHLCARALSNKKRSFLTSEFSDALMRAVEKSGGFMAASVLDTRPKPDELAVVAFGSVDLDACVKEASAGCLPTVKRHLATDDSGRQLDRVSQDHLRPYFFDPAPWASRRLDLAGLEQVSPHIKCSAGGQASTDPGPFVTRMRGAIDWCRKEMKPHRSSHRTEFADPGGLLESFMAERAREFLVAMERISRFLSRDGPGIRAPFKNPVVLHAVPYYVVSGKEKKTLSTAAAERGEWVFMSEFGRVPFEALSLMNEKEQMDELRLKFARAFRHNAGIYKPPFSGSGLFVLYNDMHVLSQSLRSLDFPSFGYAGLEPSLVVSIYHPGDIATGDPDMRSAKNAALLAMLAPHSFDFWKWMDANHRIMEVPHPRLGMVQTGDLGEAAAIAASRMSSFALRARREADAVNDPGIKGLLEQIRTKQGFDPMAALTEFPSNHDPVEVMDILRAAIRRRYARDDDHEISLVGEEHGVRLEQHYKQLESALIAHAKSILAYL